jgi:hypothetical protein
LRYPTSHPRPATTIALLIGVWQLSCAGVAPETKAVEVERLQCEPSASDEADLRLLAEMNVLSVQPLYTYVHTATTGTDKKVAGTKLLIRPPEAIDSQRVLRILQCHSARALLGKLDASKFPADPFWLAGAWLEIDLAPEAGNLALTVQAQGIRENLDVLAHARAFATTHRSSASSPAPG